MENLYLALKAFHLAPASTSADGKSFCSYQSFEFFSALCPLTPASFLTCALLLLHCTTTLSLQAYFFFLYAEMMTPL